MLDGVFGAVLAYLLAESLLKQDPAQQKAHLPKIGGLFV
jgi:hypothetical protein